MWCWSREAPADWLWFPIFDADAFSRKIGKKENSHSIDQSHWKSGSNGRRNAYHQRQFQEEQDTISRSSAFCPVWLIEFIFKASSNIFFQFRETRKPVDRQTVSQIIYEMYQRTDPCDFFGNGIKWITKSHLMEIKNRAELFSIAE